MKKIKLSELVTVQTRQISAERQKGMVELYCICDLILDLGGYAYDLEPLLENTTSFLINDSYFSTTPAIPELSKEYEKSIRIIAEVEDISLEIALYLLESVLTRYNMDSETSLNALKYLHTLSLYENKEKEFDQKIEYYFVKNMKKIFRKNNLQL